MIRVVNIFIILISIAITSSIVGAQGGARHVDTIVLPPGKLAHAAEARDYELASYHYARLIEGCAQCHAMYAKDKFPGFAPAEGQGHKH